MGTTVSRILKEAKKQGFVEINWNTPVSLDSQLSVILRKKRNLKVYILSVVKLYKVQAKK
jgi:DNA-binding transcriptional regulator LsrR (DeoR family)